MNQSKIIIGQPDIKFKQFTEGNNAVWLDATALQGIRLLTILCNPLTLCFLHRTRDSVLEGKETKEKLNSKFKELDSLKDGGVCVTLDLTLALSPYFYSDKKEYHFGLLQVFHELKRAKKGYMS